MTYVVEHLLVNTKGTTSIRIGDDLTSAHFSDAGSLPVNFPGRLEVQTRAGYELQKLNDSWQPPRLDTERKTFPLKVEIRTPDGKPFTADHITLDDIGRFRDLRGVSHGSWTYTVSGESTRWAVEKAGTPPRDDPTLNAGISYVRIAVLETIPSKSAPPLVAQSVPANQGRSFGFDLWRVGTFTATVRSTSPFIPGTPRVMKLRGPDGDVVAESDSGRLAFPVTLRTLDRSRDSAGNVRPWRLEVALPTSPENADLSVRATVIRTARIGTSPLLERLNDVIGVRGGNLNIYGEVDEGQLVARLEITDEVSAALIDRYKLLDRVLKEEDQEDGVEVDDLAAGTTYNLYKRSQTFSGAKVWIFGMRVGAIDIEIGQSVRIQPPAPALKVSVVVEGSAKIEYAGIGLGNASIRNNRIELEIGLRLAPNGTFSLVSWIPEKLVDVDIANDALLLAIPAGLLLPGVGVVTVVAAVEFFESALNRLIAEGLQAVLDGAGSQVPHILSLVLGDDFSYRALRFEGEDVVFEFNAPLEPDPKPSETYLGIIGRSAIQLGPDEWRIRPPLLGNTWAADNLNNKIQRIVVVMMENRSFDHVLGYIAAEGAANSDGLTSEITDILKAFTNPDFNPKLSASGIKPNKLDFKTKFPASVGHSVEDVAKQLSEQTTTATGRAINSPKGFLENFKNRVTSLIEDQISVDHVLGYYDGADLPFFKFLIDNYAWCERFYCSHPGPTLPNRMFWLAGDVQYDRTGEAILNNNKGSNFALSRAPSIFDLLERKGISWRVYESYPSVAMLRMFARYFTDTTNIVNIAQLEQDIADGDLPSVTFIEPAMHHDPQNDDHPPDGDMYLGQRFLQRVYDALRADEAMWAGTLLVITYDEHGGFYDHVIPPIAEARTRPMEAIGNGGIGPGHFTPDTIITKYGVRVPTFVVSPWVPAGKGPDIVLDHCSILKTILARFCGGESAPFLSDRVSSSRSFEAYLTQAAPRLDVPAPPALAPLPPDELTRRKRAIVTHPLFSSQMRRGNVDFHELTGMLARILGRDSANPVA